MKRVEQDCNLEKSSHCLSIMSPQNGHFTMKEHRTSLLPVSMPFRSCNGLARCPKNHLGGSLIPNTSKTREIKGKNITLKRLYTTLSRNTIDSLGLLKIPYNSRFLLPAFVSSQLFIVSLQPVKLAKIREWRRQSSTSNRSSLPP